MTTMTMTRPEQATRSPVEGSGSKLPAARIHAPGPDADTGRWPDETRRDPQDAGLIETNMLGLLAGSAAILGVKVSLIWVALYPL
jgi:hypothetical protein